MFSVLKIYQRIWLLTILIMSIFATTYLFETFQKRGDLFSAKQDQLNALVDTAYAVVDGAYQRQLSGELSEAQAQEEAKRQVRHMRYHGKEYFWINDMDPVMVMHPIKPELDGKNLSKTEDPNGKRLFMEMVKVVKDQGEGFVDYYWP